MTDKAMEANGKKNIEPNKIRLEGSITNERNIWKALLVMTSTSYPHVDFELFGIHDSSLNIRILKWSKIWIQVLTMKEVGTLGFDL